MIWMTFFGTFDSLILGYSLLLPILLLLFIGSIFYSKSKFRKNDLDEILSIPNILFVFASLWTYFACYDMYFVQWDEFTQWGIAPKSIFLFDLLPPSNTVPMDNLGYPPGLSVLSYLPMKIKGEWTEGIVFWTYQMIFLSIIFSVISKLNFKKIWFSIICLVILTMSSIIFYDLFQTVYADPILAIVFGYSLHLSQDKEIIKNRFKLAGFTISIIALYLIKDVGFVLAFIAIFALTLNNILTNRKSPKNLIKNIFRSIKSGVICLFFLVIARSTWISYSSKVDFSDGVSVIASQGGNATENLLGNGPALFSEVAKSFVASLVNRPITTWNGIGISAFEWLLIALLIQGSALFQKDNDRKRVISQMFIMLAGALIYFYSIFSAYLNFFGPTGPSFPSYERYISTYIAGIIFYLGIKSCEEIIQNQKNISTDRYFGYPKITTLMVLLLFFYSPQDRLIQYIKSPTAFADNFQIRFQNIREKISVAHFKPNDKIYVITQHKQGYEYYFLSYESFPADVANMPFSIGSEYGENDYWTDSNIDLKAWDKILNDFDYVIILNTSDEVNTGINDSLFMDEYSPLFNGPIESETIYFVEHTNSGNKLNKFI